MIDAHIIDSRGVYLRTQAVDPMGPQPAGAIYAGLPAAQEGHTRLWDGTAWQQVPDAEVPPLPEAMPAPVSVPSQVTRRQARQQLRMDGLLASVQPAIDAIEDELQRDIAQIYWDDSQEFARHHPLLIGLGTAMGFDSEQIDQLFISAAALA